MLKLTYFSVLRNKYNSNHTPTAFKETSKFETFLNPHSFTILTICDQHKLHKLDSGSVTPM